MDEEQNEEEDDDEVEGGDMNDDSDDDTAMDGTVATQVGNAEAPVGYKIVTDCPPLESESERQALIGKRVLYGWDSAQAHGWFLGTVHSASLSATDLRNVPTATHAVKYIAKETDTRLNGKVACELSGELYGPDKWWVLVEAA